MKAILAILLVTAAGLAQSLAQTAAPDLARGHRLYSGNCAPCHGPRGDGGKGSDLTAPRLRRAPDDQTLFRLIRSGIPGAEMPGTRHLRDRDILDVIAYLKSLRAQPVTLPGDPRRGEQLYRTKGNCAQCHTLGGRGGATGPDLTDIGAHRSPAHLRESLLTPEASVPENYMVYRLFSVIPDSFLQVRLVTTDGRRLTGVRVNEDPFSIQIRDFSDRLHSFWKSELAQLDKDWGRSPMPGYRDVFTAAELDDLVAYLVSLRGEL